ncbi:hypothetical protein G9P44_003899 [Scheffersomyces stipitis]|nr:hypothetical protein G9P44_003899 [Scheffersomyces stipitis]
MSSLKEQKEQFVSDLLGGSVSEIYAVTGVALTSYLAFRIYDVLVSHEVSFLYDFILNCLPILVSITLYSDKVTTLHLAIIVPILSIFVFSKYTFPDLWKSNGERTSHNVNKQSKSAEKQLLPKKSFITAYRAHMLIITNLAILAVDFNVFPRRFAKVETWGTSLMDLGVGSFVFSMGLVNSRAIIKNKFNRRSSDSGYKFSVVDYFSVVKRSIVKSVPLLVLGGARLVSVKSLEYQEHVSEYGIHWNFFITLGLLPVLLGVLDPVLNVVPRAVVALVITIGYEIVLVNTELLRFILVSDNRLQNLITMNKEGIFSFFGYFAIFVFGQSFGSFVLTNYKTPYNMLTFVPQKETSGKKKKKHSQIKSWLTVNTTNGLIIASIFYQMLFYFVRESGYILNVSRRLANLPYVLWVVSYNATLLLGYNLIEKFFPESHESYLLESTNSNGLLIFLIANVSTGLVNMTINTLECSDPVAFAILTVYAAGLCLLSNLLNYKGIYVKL